VVPSQYNIRARPSFRHTTTVTATVLTRNLIFALWVIWLVYWLLAARGSKPVRRREGSVTRAAFLAQALLTALLLAPLPWSGWLWLQVVGGGWTRYWSAVALIVIGLALSIWARRSLGGNWSGSVTVKEGHELVQSGPYRWIRHPIYTGLLLMMLGTGLASGRVHGLLAFPVALSALWLKSRVEERWMATEFGERYALYRQRSWALIPFVL
jgi:protein-S-isoprenylcysteine O-methyltransferase Ste14